MGRGAINSNRTIFLFAQNFLNTCRYIWQNLVGIRERTPSVQGRRCRSLPRSFRREFRRQPLQGFWLSKLSAACLHAPPASSLQGPPPPSAEPQWNVPKTHRSRPCSRGYHGAVPFAPGAVWQLQRSSVPYTPLPPKLKRTGTSAAWSPPLRPVSAFLLIACSAASAAADKGRARTCGSGESIVR